MKYRLIAFDMDNTLLDSNKEISCRAAEDIRYAAQLGCHVVICTGRSYIECEKYLKMLPELRYLVCDSGSTVIDSGVGEYIFSASFDREEMELVVNAAGGLSFTPTVHAGGKLYAEKRAKANLNYYDIGCYDKLFSETGEWVDDPLDCALGRDDVNKLDFFFHSNEDKALFECRLAGLDATLTGGTPKNVEVVPKRCTKGNGLARLCEYLGIPVSEAVACGDGDNDVSMIETAGLGVSMGNGVDRLKQAADVVVADCDSDGAAEALERFILLYN